RRLTFQVGVQLGQLLWGQALVLGEEPQAADLFFADLLVCPDHLQEQLYQLQAVVLSSDTHRRRGAHLAFVSRLAARRNPSQATPERLLGYPLVGPWVRVRG